MASQGGMPWEVRATRRKKKKIVLFQPTHPTLRATADATLARPPKPTFGYALMAGTPRNFSPRSLETPGDRAFFVKNWCGSNEQSVFGVAEGHGFQAAQLAQSIAASLPSVLSAVALEIASRPAAKNTAGLASSAQKRSLALATPLDKLVSTARLLATAAGIGRAGEAGGVGSTRGPAPGSTAAAAAAAGRTVLQQRVVEVLHGAFARLHADCAHVVDASNTGASVLVAVLRGRTLAVASSGLCRAVLAREVDGHALEVAIEGVAREGAVMGECTGYNRMSGMARVGRLQAETGVLDTSDNLLVTGSSLVGTGPGTALYSSSMPAFPDLPIVIERALTSRDVTYTKPSGLEQAKRKALVEQMRAMGGDPAAAVTRRPGSTGTPSTSRSHRSERAATPTWRGGPVRPGTDLAEGETDAGPVDFSVPPPGQEGSELGLAVTARFGAVRAELAAVKAGRATGSGESAAAVADELAQSRLFDECGRPVRVHVPVPLSVDHRPDRPDELSRIQLCGGKIGSGMLKGGLPGGLPRVFGVGVGGPGLTTSRCIGYTSATPLGVIPDPEVTLITLGPSDRFVVIATSGVWSVLTSAQAVTAVAGVLGGILWGGSAGAEYGKMTRAESKEEEEEEESESEEGGEEEGARTPQYAIALVRSRPARGSRPALPAIAHPAPLVIVPPSPATEVGITLAAGQMPVAGAGSAGSDSPLDLNDSVMPPLARARRADRLRRVAVAGAEAVLGAAREAWRARLGADVYADLTVLLVLLD